MDSTLCISVKRGHLLADALREARKERFDSKKMLKVHSDISVVACAVDLFF